MLADEAHHRDVNHTIASLPKGAENPFIKEHMEDFDAAAKRRVDALLKAAAVVSRATLACQECCIANGLTFVAWRSKGGRAGEEQGRVMRGLFCSLLLASSFRQVLGIR
eukprot:scaffold184_cov316-Pinguiococcus_pyrenoidosus.AAC.42